MGGNLRFSLTETQKVRDITLELTAGVKDGKEIGTVASSIARSVALEFRLHHINQWFSSL
jgi:hypothetical protein